MKRKEKERTCWDFYSRIPGSLATGIGDCVLEHGEDSNAITQDREYRKKHRFPGKGVSSQCEKVETERVVNVTLPLLSMRCVWAIHVKMNRRQANIRIQSLGWRVGLAM